MPGSGGPCCWTGVCCDPPRQAAALASHLGIPAEAAQAVAGGAPGEGHVLVPRSLPGQDGRQVEAAAQRLERLHRVVKTEMQAILVDLGYRGGDGA